MKIIYSDLKNGEVKVRVENSDDVFTLSTVISEGDIVRGLCERKIKIGSGERAKSVKKTFLSEIVAEKVDFDKNIFQLRVNGKTLQESEDVPKGSYQAIEVGEGAVITIKKDKWLTYQLKKIKEAEQEQKGKTILVLADRENATFALLKKSGYETLFNLEGEVEKKAFETKKSSNFFEEIIKKIKDCNERYGPSTIVIASPAFWKEEIAKMIKEPSIRQKVVTATCNSVTESGINEILKGEEMSKILKQERAAVENALVEEILREISKEGLAAYGEKEVSEAAAQSNIKKIVFTDNFFIRKNREEARNFDELLKNCEKKNAEIHIISSEHEGGKRLEGLGGVAALLRYKSYN